MTTQPSIESLRETLYEIIPPSDPESEHPGRFSDLLAALDELERLRQMPTLEAAAIARAEKAEAARDQWRRYAEDQRQGWSAAMVSVQTAQTILELLVDGEEVKEEARRWLRGSAHTDLEANDARVRREALGTGGVEAIAAERKRQMEVEGWTPEHDDDEHGGEQLAAAASAYLLHDLGVPVLDHGAIPCLNRRVWPWGFAWWKPKSYRKNLIRAGALIAAEIDRLDRKSPILGAAQPQTSGEEEK